MIQETYYIGIINKASFSFKRNFKKIQGKSDKEIEEQIELYMFNKGKDLGGGEEKDNEAE